MSLPKIPLTPLWGEVGRDRDWKGAALVEEIGTSNDGETKIVRTLNGGRFELWHQSGLKMRIPLEAMLDEACEALRLEALEREGAKS